MLVHDAACTVDGDHDHTLSLIFFPLETPKSDPLDPICHGLTVTRLILTYWIFHNVYDTPPLLCSSILPSITLSCCFPFLSLFFHLSPFLSPPSLPPSLPPFFYLPRPGYWSVTLQSNLCVVPFGYEDNTITSCVVYFSVCKALPGEQCGGVTNSSTCQEVVMNDGRIYYYSIGDYRGNNEFEATGDPIPSPSPSLPLSLSLSLSLSLPLFPKEP